LLRRADAFDGLDSWPMVRRAAPYLFSNGPATQQDRWSADGWQSVSEVETADTELDFAFRRFES
jgi:hypothetical protein